MRVKILSSTSTFNGVSYNTNKTQNSKGELMKFRNFGYIQTASSVTPDEMKSFLKAYSNRNYRVKDQQFHAMVSCKGREFGKEQLTRIAEDWLHKMGYGENPYLIVFHSDTENNHVHVVSTRIGQDGKKINDSMEKIKAQTNINEIMSLDPKRECQDVIQNLEKHQFSTLSQAKLLLENHGFKIKDKDGKWLLFKYGLIQGEVSEETMQNKCDSYAPNAARNRVLKALFNKYKEIYNVHPIPYYEPLKGNREGKQLGCNSEFSKYIKANFGIEIIYHGKKGEVPYGYSIIDHSHKQILKGSEIISLKNLSKSTSKEKADKILVTNAKEKKAYQEINKSKLGIFVPVDPSDYKSLRLRLLTSLNEHATINQGLAESQLKVSAHKDKLYVFDQESRLFVKMTDVLTTAEYNHFATHFEVSPLQDKQESLPENKDVNYDNPFFDSGQNASKDDTQPIENEHELWTERSNENSTSFTLSITDDEDDEAMRRRGKRRKNS
jgi:hypothetical protein